MTRHRMFAAAVLAGVLFASPLIAGGGIYGTVTTDDGTAHTGYIRWDKNENYWNDVLDTAKRDRIEMPRAGEGLNLKIFGWEIVRAGGSGGSTVIHPRFTIPFGHIRTIEKAAEGVRIVLKNGDAKMVANGADVGSSMRGIVVETGGGQIEIEWKEFRRVEFAAAPDATRDAQRLYGEVATTVGDFTGYVVWDRDESLEGDVLNGTDRFGDRRKIPFSSVKRIENRGNGAEIWLKTGDSVRLSGSNDVDDDNRGIDVVIRDLGTVKIGWRDFVAFTPASPPPSPAYDTFDGGKKLSGTVTTRDGRSFTGDIVWDLDEEYTWEALDGEIEGVDFSVLFQHIERIERRSRRGAKVTLRDGLELMLKNSNDVDEENKGILVQTADGEVMLVWDELAEAVFAP